MVALNPITFRPTSPATASSTTLDVDTRAASSESDGSRNFEAHQEFDDVDDLLERDEEKAQLRSQTLVVVLLLAPFLGPMAMRLISKPEVVVLVLILILVLVLSRGSFKKCKRDEYEAPLQVLAKTKPGLEN